MCAAATDNSVHVVNGINNYKIIVKATTEAATEAGAPLRSRFDHSVINSVDYVNGSSTLCVLQRLTKRSMCAAATESD
jgi:hypothetical protein